jgi:hypothetical protein
MAKEYSENRSTKAESSSDEEISLAIRYLDPEPKRNAFDTLAFIAFFIVLFLCAILIALRLPGL